MATLLSDNFERADSTGDGSAYVRNPGTWKIAGNRLYTNRIYTKTFAEVLADRIDPDDLRGVGICDVLEGMWTQ